MSPEKGEKAIVGAMSLTQQTPGFEITYLGGQHPEIEGVVEDFCARAAICGGASQVTGSGPAKIGTLLRESVAKRNDARKVWQGDRAGVLGLEWDCRS